MTAQQRDSLIAGLYADRERLLRRLDAMPNSAMGTPDWDRRIVELEIIKAALVGLGVEDGGRKSAFELATAALVN